MPMRRDESLKWETYEVAEPNGDGEHSYPFSEALAVSGGPPPVQAITKIRMLQAIGWPTAKNQLKDNLGKPLVVKKDDRIWLLKCKPSCWRLYFYVWDNETKNCLRQGGLQKNRQRRSKRRRRCPSYSRPYRCCRALHVPRWLKSTKLKSLRTNGPMTFDFILRATCCTFGDTAGCRKRRQERLWVPANLLSPALRVHKKTSQWTHCSASSRP